MIHGYCGDRLASWIDAHMHGKSAASLTVQIKLFAIKIFNWEIKSLEIKNVKCSLKFNWGTISFTVQIFIFHLNF